MKKDADDRPKISKLLYEALMHANVVVIRRHLFETVRTIEYVPSLMEIAENPALSSPAKRGSNITPKRKKRRK